MKKLLKNLSEKIPWLNRQIVGGILVLAAVYTGTTIVVHIYKKPGRMTVIEAQAMDMTVMKAPVGSVPVAVEEIQEAPLQEAVTYTGSVVPYNEVDVYPRVQGWLEWMPLYPGDKVKQGQLIAKLDTRELASKVNEAKFGEIATANEEKTFHVEFQQIENKIEASKSAVEEARAEVSGMKAKMDYWEKEFEREKTLYENGAVSKEEYQSEKAEYEMAKANLKQAHAKLNMAQQEFEVMNLESTRAHHHVKHLGAMTQKMKAEKTTASIIQSYTKIKSPISGYVIRRMLSPGILVSPGTAIIKIAQMNRVRLQANVAEADLKGIKAGNPVFVTSMKNSGEAVEASVTSVFPAADPSARTGIVEAVVDNTDLKFFPGEYVVMKITKNAKEDVLSVPSSAITTVNEKGEPAVWIVQRVKKGGKVIYQCLMHPEVQSDKPGKCHKCGMKLEPKETSKGMKAHLIYVKTGITNGERTEIVSGLKEKDEVIYAGNEYLNEGDNVFPTTWGMEGPEKLPEPPTMEGMEEMPGHKGH